mmetsp:Transcript_29770/g.71923  ORF Transcript_29770/g.71923 Transcript_29770/m.71923 type:complete len:254 (+) Transcript_29770:411-1172(+)
MGGGFVVGSLECRLVEVLVLLLGHIGGRSQPDGLVGVHPLVTLGGLRHRLHLGLLALGWLVGLLVRHLLVLCLLLPYRDRKLHEFGVLLQELLELGRLHVFHGVVLEMQNETRSRSLDGIIGVFRDGVRARCVRRPLQLRRVRLHALGHDLDLIGHQIRRVESDTELSNEVDVRGSLPQGLEKLFGPALRDPTEVVLELTLGHSHATVLDRDGHGVLIRFDVDRGRDGGGIGIADGEEALLVAGVCGVGNELA